MDKIFASLNLLPEHILATYQFGSRVYGSQRPDSDHDYICVVTQYPAIGTLYDKDDICIHFLTKKEYLAGLASHDIRCLECYFLPEKNKTEQAEMQNLPFTLDKGKLRQAISTVSNGSWIKGKKKLIVMADYNRLLALKSIFHSIRILDVGLQVLNHGKIANYAKMNWLLTDLLETPVDMHRQELWDWVQAKHKSLFDQKKRELKALCPKSSMEHQSKKERLIKILEAYKIQPKKELVRSILEIFS